MVTEKDIKDQIRNLSQHIYDDRKILEMHGMLNSNALSDEQKIDLEIEDLLIRKRIEKNEMVRDRLYAKC